MNESSLTSRAIRSFVIRNGRLTGGQKEAMDTLMPVYGLPYSNTVIDFGAVFGNQAPVWLEIGFGNGEALLSIATAHPELNFLGIEVHAPGVGHLLAGIRDSGLTNVRVMRHDALEVLATMIPAGTVQRVLLLFPDPWHKKRHHKRRILQTEAVRLIDTALTDGGVLHCATDWADYAASMLEVLSQQQSWGNLSDTGGYALKPDYRSLTKFEQRGLRLGHSVADLLFRKNSRSVSDNPPA